MATEISFSLIFGSRWRGIYYVGCPAKFSRLSVEAISSLEMCRCREIFCPDMCRCLKPERELYRFYLDTCKRALNPKQSMQRPIIFVDRADGLGQIPSLA